MSLDISLYAFRKINVFELNITHNLAKMASVVDIDGRSLYYYMWKPKDLGIRHAGQLVVPLKKGLEILKDDPEKFKKYNPPNGWGSYDKLVFNVLQLIQACEEDPYADISTSR